MALDQLVYSPVMAAVFLTALKVMEGSPAAVLPFLQARLVPTVLAGWTVWPAVNAVNFKFVPEDLRILFLSLVGIVSAHARG